MSRLICSVGSPILLLLGSAVSLGTGIIHLAETSDRVDPENAPKAGVVRTFEIAKGVEMEFCWIPSGEAQLGAPKTERDRVSRMPGQDSEPDWLAAEAAEKRGRFKTKGFWLGKYTVTQAQWKAVMGNNPSEFDGKTDNKAKGLVTDRFPVDKISWNDCQKFLAALNKRPGAAKVFGGTGRFVLPHEDEWEYACRGGKGNGRAFYWGNELNGTQANCNGMFPYGTEKEGESKERTTEVGSYAKDWPHPWGLCDMHGNVLQWCSNKYEPTEDARVLRGGSWFSNPDGCRAASRYWHGPHAHLNDMGLRVEFHPD